MCYPPNHGAVDAPQDEGPDQQFLPWTDALTFLIDALSDSMPERTYAAILGVVLDRDAAPALLASCVVGMSHSL